jgi:hypothetical protein
MQVAVKSLQEKVAKLEGAEPAPPIGPWSTGPLKVAPPAPRPILRPPRNWDVVQAQIK